MTNTSLEDSYRSMISGMPKEGAVALLEQELKDADEIEDQATILGLIQELNCE